MVTFRALLLILLSFFPTARCFGLIGHLSARTTRLSASTAGMGDSYLLDEFKIHSGEIINPYRVLKVSRKADRSEIKQSYRTLSRRYHPDGNMHKREILPGSCNNWDEVRDHWERIKLAYEILSDPRSRKRYDRHEALADPSAAIQRAAVNAAFSGVAGVGKGIFSMGNFALNQLKKQASDSADKNEVSE